MNTPGSTVPYSTASARDALHWSREPFYRSYFTVREGGFHFQSVQKRGFTFFDAGKFQPILDKVRLKIAASNEQFL